MKRISPFVVLLALVLPDMGRAQEPVLVALGDSLSEAVQSAEASEKNQTASFVLWMARKMDAEMPLPLIRTWPLGQVYDSERRRRIDPTVETLNLAVSGANVRDVLRRRADASTTDEIDSETDLVLFPRMASQIEIAEALGPEYVVCWIGGNDVLSAATSFDNLDASQMTSVASFTASFRELTGRLDAIGAKVVFGNIPDVTAIPFLMDASDLRKFTGDDFGLAPGDYTTLPLMVLLRLGLDDGSLLADPDFVLDAYEIARIQERAAVLNEVIASEAAAIGAPVVDTNALVSAFATRTLNILGIRISGDYLGGIFSLDGVHPSNVTHVVLAGAFLAKMNAHYGTRFPLPTIRELAQTLLKDPHVDKDGDLRVRGIPLNGALETFGPLLGISGDVNDFRAGPRPRRDPAQGRELMLRLRRRKGFSEERLREWNREEVLDAFRELFGRKAFRTRR